MLKSLAVPSSYPYDDGAMTNKTSPLRRALLLSALCVAWVGIHPVASAQSASASSAGDKADAKPGILDRAQAAAILPKTVFYKNLSATVQERNSAGIRFGNGDLVLVALVDTSGYSSAVQQTYQAYLLNEVHFAATTPSTSTRKSSAASPAISRSATKLCLRAPMASASSVITSS